MASTKTNATKPKTIPGLVEAQGIADQLNLARKDLARYSADLEQARSAADSLVARLNDGDSGVSATDLSAADAEVQRATMLADAAKRTVSRLEASRIVTDTDAAESFARCLVH